MKGFMTNMKVVQLVAILVLFLAAVIHDHGRYVMANEEAADAAAAYAAAHPEPKIRMYGGSDGGIGGPEPIPFFIVGLNSLCVEAHRNVPKIGECKNSIKQKWLLLADLTIRPAVHDGMCLTANDIVLGSDVLILPCRSDLSSYQHWQYKTSDRTIVNLAGKFVLDVQNSELSPSGQHIIIYTWKGGDNQKWFLEP